MTVTYPATSPPPKAAVLGPVRRVKTTLAYGTQFTVPPEAGTLYVLCSPARMTYFVDTTHGDLRIGRVDGGTVFDLYYRYVTGLWSPPVPRISAAAPTCP
jgi:hypothetical protein